MISRTHLSLAVTAATLAAAVPAAAVTTPAAAPTGPTFTRLATYATGLADPTAGVSSGETAALRGSRLYVTNADDVSLDIVDVSDPTRPVLVRRVDLSAYGSAATSVDVSSKNLVAVAVEADPPTDPGTVVFLTPAGTVVRTATVGAGPDMVTFTPDGRHLLVANEGEPSCYGTDATGAPCVDPEGSVSVVTVVPRPPVLPVDTIGFAGVPIPAGVRLFGPGATPAQDLEPEYIAVSADGTTAWVTLQENNAVAVLDLVTRAVRAIVPLGWSDHGRAGFGLDASDRDNAVNIRPWPGVRGMYQPDAIAAYTVGGTTYLVTANEGDARDYRGFSEEVRARNAGVAVPGVSNNAQLGRLTVTNTPPGGDRSNLYAFGSRSFSIWDAATGALVWDSGDALEQRTAAAFPAFFNSNNTSNSFDDRSDNKGPEPEAVAVGVVGGRTYAFVGLERIGGVMVYDVTDPTAPVFVEYLTNRDFTASPVGPDSGPEVVRFVDGRHSPTGRPLVVVANEITGTVTLYEVAP